MSYMPSMIVVEEADSAGVFDSATQKILHDLTRKYLNRRCSWAVAQRYALWELLGDEFELGPNCDD